MQHQRELHWGSPGQNPRLKLWNHISQVAQGLPLPPLPSFKQHCGERLCLFRLEAAGRTGLDAAETHTGSGLIKKWTEHEQFSFHPWRWDFARRAKASPVISQISDLCTARDHAIFTDPQPSLGSCWLSVLRHCLKESTQAMLYPPKSSLLLHGVSLKTLLTWVL